MQGRFGTRLVVGKDAALPRYMFTHLTPFVQLLFPEDNDVLLSIAQMMARPVPGSSFVVS
jgi:hypothetical protein